MARMLSRLYRIFGAALLGAQLFFSGAAAQVAFPAEVAALPAGSPRKALAGDLVGGMLARLDAATLVVTALLVVFAVLIARRRAALLPLLAGLSALASTALVQPAIHAMRIAGQTSLPRFGQLHGASAGLLILQMVLLLIAVLRAPEA